MDVSHLLTQEAPQRTRTPQLTQQQHSHQYPTRQSMSLYGQQNGDGNSNTPPAPQYFNGRHSGTPTPYNLSPASPNPKHVAFELLFPESPTCRARLPMRVQIFPHDTTDSIITTVKNFYGLYEGKGVSFEDESGNILIARYENLRNNMIVYVRVVADHSGSPDGFRSPSNIAVSPVGSHKMPHLDEAFQMLPPQYAQQLHIGRPPSRSMSRTARKRSVSPQPGRGRRSISASNMKKARSRSGFKSRGSSAHDSQQDLNSDAMDDYSSGDGGQGSVSSSRKAKSEQLASAEISLDNILEGGRRKRAKFESSELPLFVPPQVPMTTSTSSISPQRRVDGQNAPSPFAYPTQRNFSYNQPSQSPQSFGYGGQAFGNPRQTASSYSTPSEPQHGHKHRTRANASYPSSRHSTGAMPTRAPGILPTPDPTVASCISDEDVALQLMRLGDTSNISNGTRNSNSTLDDGLSGAADIASSTGATSESGNEIDGTEKPSLPLAPREQIESSPIPLPGSIKKRHKHLDEILPSFDSTEPSGNEIDGDYEFEDKREGSFKQEDIMNELEDVIKPQPSKPRSMAKPRSSTSSSKNNKTNKPRSANPNKKFKSSLPMNGSKLPISPTSLPPQSRKPSTASTLNFQNQLGEDEEDLSSKPRCQRCRKSKKGCDRQRPCQRCKDAGIGGDGCVSEDEGNGRKGRYGRHMGVSVKKDAAGNIEVIDDEYGVPQSAMQGVIMGRASPDKGKKRKR